MKTLLAAVVAVLTSAITLSAADDATAHDALRAIKATYEKAVSSGDLAPLKELFTPETSAVMLLGQEIKSYPELEAHWTYVRGLLGTGGTYSTKLNPEPSLIYGDLALARGTSDEAVKASDGREFHFQSRWTAMCRLVDGRWKVLRLHASMDPVNNVFTTAFVQKAKMLYGLGGIALGAVLGLIVGRLTKRSASPSA